MSRHLDLPAPEAAESGAVARVRQSCADLVWRPRPVPPPEPDRELQHRAALMRGSEVIAFTVLRIEFFLSPGGLLREWLRLVLLVSAGLALPALVLAPLLLKLASDAVVLTAYATAAAVSAAAAAGVLSAAALALLLTAAAARRLLGRPFTKHSTPRWRYTP